MRWLAKSILLSFGFVLSAEEAILIWTGLKDRTMEARFIKFTGDLKGAKEATRRAFELNREYRANFVEGEDSDAAWRTFG